MHELHAAGHLLEIFMLFVLAQLCGQLSSRLHQPAVLGYIFAGILLGPSAFDIVHENEALDTLAELGAVLLLFVVGLEVKLRDILKVGKQAALVACIGMVLPFMLAYGFGHMMGIDQMATLFLATAITATSVGITASVLQELQVLSRFYTRIILGAAIIDDILSLLLLSVVSGVKEAGALEWWPVLKMSAMSIGFVVAIGFAVPFVKKINLGKLPFTSPFAVVLSVALGAAGMASLVGLAPIVGAFLAGMLFAEVEDEYDLLESIGYLEAFLVPLFFAVVGDRLDLAVLFDPYVIRLGLGFVAIAFFAKLVAGIGAWSNGPVNAAIVGVGMTPRGEVVLVVAALALTLGAFSQKEYAIAVMMVLVTTIVAPMILRPLIKYAERDATD